MARPRGATSPGNRPVAADVEETVTDPETSAPRSNERGVSALRVVAIVFVCLFVIGAVLAGVAAYGTWFRYGWPVAGSSRPASFALRDGTMALLQNEDGQTYSVATVDLSDGARDVFFGGAGQARTIALDDTWLVWSACDDVGVMPCSGRTVAARRDHGGEITLLQSPADAIVAWNGAFYLRVANGLSRAEPGSKLDFAHGDVSDVAAADDALYVLTPTSLEALEPQQEKWRTLAAGCPDGGHLAAKAGGVFVACSRSGKSDDPIDWVPLDGTLRVHIGDVNQVETMVASSRGLVLVYETPDPESPGTLSSTLGLIRSPGAAMTLLLERSGWGPLAVRDDELYLLEYHAVMKRRIP
jgi:hypothetical protein